MAEYLYIHIPFCVRKCSYCDFVSFPHDPKLAARYTEALCRELAMRKESADLLRTIYFGGGTPSILEPECWNRIFETMRRNFRIAPETEITIEANPGTLDRSKLDFFRSQGVNRISIGIQSLHDSELRALGRIHSAAETAAAVCDARAAGFENLAVDLMYGIPGQTLDSWRETVDGVIALGPRHLSAYELTLEPGTPLCARVEKGSIQLPEEDDVLAMFHFARSRTAAAGYEHYEISNYAVPGYRSLHNQNYWTRNDYLGAGAGAHSFAGRIRTRNHGDLEAYCSASEAGNLPEAESAMVSEGEACREFIFLGLRRIEGIALSEGAAYGLDLAGAAEELIGEHYLEISGERIRLTEKGLPVSNSVFVMLYEELGL